MSASRLFAVRYRFDRGRRSGHTVVSGPTREAAVAQFARRNPHVEVLR